MFKRKQISSGVRYNTIKYKNVVILPSSHACLALHRRLPSDLKTWITREERARLGAFN